MVYCRSRSSFPCGLQLRGLVWTHHWTGEVPLMLAPTEKPR
jgi:hypothetical protein